MKIKKANRASQTPSPPFAGKPIGDRSKTQHREPVGHPSLTRAELEEWIQRAKALPDVRSDKVREIVEALESGSYDVDAKLSELSGLSPEEFMI